MLKNKPIKYLMQYIKKKNMIKLVAFLIIICTSITMCSRGTKNFKEKSILGNYLYKDSVYNKEKILRVFIETIKKSDSLFDYRITEKNELVGFFVYDLIDTFNFQNADMFEDNHNHVYFKDNHVYHFASAFFEESTSNIAFFENGEVKIFESINCKKSKFNLDSVIAFLSPRINKGKNEFLESIIKYRKFGKYFAHDNYGLKLKCDCLPCY